MGLIAYTSQNYETLLDKWISNILAEQQRFGVHESKIVVPNHKVASWLNRSMAERLGISMNLRFIYLDSLIHDCFDAQCEQPGSGVKKSNSLPLQWTRHLWSGFISGELPDLAVESLSDPHPKSELQWMQLAWECSSLLQQYAEYRPHWLSAWESFSNRSTSELEAYQQGLFRYLLKKGVSHHPLVQLEQAVSINAPLQKYPLHFFGFWNFSPSKWHLLEQLVDAAHGYVYLPFPTEGYLADLTRKELQQPLLLGEDGIKMGPNYMLLSKLGQRGRAMQMLMLDDGVETEERFSPSHVNAQKRLHALQAQLSTPDQFEPPVHLLEIEKDQSIQVHSVCNHRREVEVVKAIIQKALLQISDLALESIHVSAPDISVYANLIAEIFDSDPPEQRLSYGIQNAMDADKVQGIQVVFEYLRLLKSDWDASEIVHWLSLDPIRKSFEFSLSDIELIKHWIACAGIFRGNPSQGVHSQTAHSWEAGIRELMQAYAGELPRNALGKTAYQKDPPDQHVETFSKFCAWYDLMKRAARTLAVHTYTSEHFRNQLSRAMDQILPDTNEFEKQVLLSALNRLAEHFSGLKLDLGTFVYLLRKTLPKLPPPQFVSRKSGIQFSCIQAEDLVPCRVRILMGMNESDFPAADVPQSHNLLTRGESIPTDPSRKEDQRYWVLQSIHQTSEQWIATYQGQDASGNQTRLLSPTIEAVIAAVNHFAASIHAEGSAVPIIQHPRFAYDPVCFGAQADLRHFSVTDFNIAKNLTASSDSNEPASTIPCDLTSIHTTTDGDTSISIWELAEFFANPNKVACQKYLGIRFPDVRDYSLEHEPLIWGGLSASYALNTDVLRAQALGLGRSDLKAVLRTHHTLFSGSIQEIGIDSSLSEIKSISRIPDSSSIRLLETLPAELCRSPISKDLQLLHPRFIDPLPQHIRLCTVRASNLRSSLKLEAWIHALGMWMLQTPENRAPFLLLCKDKVLELNAPEDPTQCLNPLMELYRSYQGRSMPFFPATSEAYIRSNLPLETMDQHPSWEGDYGEKLDPYNAYMFRVTSPFGPEFEALANTVYTPLLSCNPPSSKKGSIS